MITNSEYLKAKKIVEEYEDQEYTDGMNNAMYCVGCQAFNAQECFCDEEDESTDCNYCCGSNGNHFIECPYNNNPFHNLLRDGYD